MVSVTPNSNKFRLSRRGRKLNLSDDQRLLLVLPKDITERTWAEIIQREEGDLLVFDIREEILDEALQIGYQRYMERQQAKFTSYCAAEALLKLIDWHFYCHDPGEDSASYPPCYIPKREASWTSDNFPEPSPKDPITLQSLNTIECEVDQVLEKWPSSSSLDLPVVEEIPEECWFPGKVELPNQRRKASAESDVSVSLSEEEEEEDSMAAVSEVLQKITDYDLPELRVSSRASKVVNSMKQSTSVDGSLQGAGDSLMHSKKDKCKFPVHRMSTKARMVLPHLPPIDKHPSAISDCRLRNPRLDTCYEISTEKMDSPPGEIIRRKGA